MRRLAITLIATAALALTACGGEDSDSESGAQFREEAEAAEANELADAYETCAADRYGNPLGEERDKVDGSEVLSLEDDDQTVIVDGYGDQFVSAPAAFCVLEEIDAPASTRTNMEATTSVMGRQTDEWDGYAASWSFHPDNGFDLVLERTE